MLSVVLCVLKKILFESVNDKKNKFNTISCVFTDSIVLLVSRYSSVGISLAFRYVRVLQHSVQHNISRILFNEYLVDSNMSKTGLPYIPFQLLPSCTTHPPPPPSSCCLRGMTVAEGSRVFPVASCGSDRFEGLSPSMAELLKSR